MFKETIVSISLTCIVFVTTVNSCISQRLWAGTSTTIAGPVDYLIEECADTLINDTLWISFTERFFYGDSGWYEQSALIHENNGKITVYNKNIRPRKYLIYDFSLGLSDTFFYLYPYTFAPFEVVEVDSVDILGVLRKRMKLRHVIGMYEDVWVEGVGSIKHNFFSPCEDPSWVDAGSGVSCFKTSAHSEVYHFVDSQYCFINEIDPICNEFLAIQEREEDLDISIFPNPVNEILEVRTSEIIEHYAIYSIEGARLISGKPSRLELRLDEELQVLSPAMYVIVINTRKGRHFSRFIKQ